jgi:hypothetical protein
MAHMLERVDLDDIILNFDPAARRYEGALGEQMADKV